MPAPIRLEGFALHAGTRTAVTLAPHEGPITLGRGNHRAVLDSLRITRTDFGVAVADDGGFELDLVEHLLAALGGLGIRRGVMALVEGPELPILDGGARTFADALTRLEIPEASPELVVQRQGRLDFGDGWYEFGPGDSVEMVVDAVFEHPAIGRQQARWNGDPRSFRDEIAPARTFGFASQADELLRRGRAGLAAGHGAETETAALKSLREAVVILDESPHVPRFSENEMARHKLLDMIGDFVLYGGPPLGSVLAHRPGHTATHRIVQRALGCGILSRR